MLWNMSILNLKTVAGLWIGGGKKMCFCLFLSGISRVKLCKKNPILYNNDYLFLMIFTWEFCVRVCATVCERTQG